MLYRHDPVNDLTATTTDGLELGLYFEPMREPYDRPRSAREMSLPAHVDADGPHPDEPCRFCRLPELETCPKRNGSAVKCCW
jgi:hypothetical protein